MNLRSTRCKCRLSGDTLVKGLQKLIIDGEMGYDDSIALDSMTHFYYL